MIKMKAMENRVYGLIGIRAVRSNWNADFTGRPRTDAAGNIVATDKALKYACRRYWNNNGEKIFYFKSINENCNPRTLRERYDSMFGDLSAEKDTSDVMLKLFSCLDVMNFGAAFTEGKVFSITGAIQIQQGINAYPEGAAETLDILSPFRNPNNKKDGAEKTQSTKGEQIIADECHYLYPFVVTPDNYVPYLTLKDFSGYSREAYEKFKEAAKVAVTAIQSCQKAGCDNEFAMFIELKKNSKKYIPSLSQYVKFSKKEDVSTYDLTLLTTLINEMKGDVSSIEIYFNPVNTKVVTDLDDNLVKQFNIFTNAPINL